MKIHVCILAVGMVVWSGAAFARPGSFTLSAPTASCNGALPVIRLNWSTASGATSYDVYRNDAYYDTVAAPGRTYLNSANLVAGNTYRYYISARDASGARNSSTVSAQAPTNCTVAANRAPSLSRTSPSASTIPVGQPYTVSLSATDADGNLSHIDVDWNDGSGNQVERRPVNGAQGSATFERAFSSARTINWSATAYDQAGAASPMQQGTFMVISASTQNRAPTLTILSSGGPAIEANNRFRITISVVDPDANLSHVDIDWNDGSLSEVERRNAQGSESLLSFERTFASPATINWSLTGYDMAGARSAMESGILVVTAVPLLPVLYVHGFCSNSEALDPLIPAAPASVTQLYWDGKDVRDWRSRDLSSRFDSGDRSRKTFTIDFWDPTRGTAVDSLVAQVSIKHKARELREVLAEVRRISGQSHVVLIGHSMGGLVSRAYVEGLASRIGADNGSVELFRRDVAALITIDTPHKGSWLAHLAIPTNWPPCTLESSLNKDEMEPDSAFLRDLDRVTLPSDVFAFAIQSYRKGAFIPPGDGVVDFASQSLKTTSPYSSWPTVFDLPNAVAMDSRADLKDLHSLVLGASETFGVIDTALAILENRGSVEPPPPNSPPAPVPSPPLPPASISVTTGIAHSVSQTTATLSASVATNTTTSVVFDYGATTGYGSVSTSASVGPTPTSVIVERTISALSCGTIYQYRARDIVTGTVGTNRSFTTQPCPSPAPSPAPAPSPTPPSSPAPVPVPASITITTRVATSIRQTSAWIGAEVATNVAINLVFDYGQTSSYGRRIDYGSLAPAQVHIPEVFLQGLACGTTYHFRARDSISGISGANRSFTTAGCGN